MMVAVCDLAVHSRPVEWHAFRDWLYARAGRRVSGFHVLKAVFLNSYEFDFLYANDLILDSATTILHISF